MRRIVHRNGRGKVGGGEWTVGIEEDTIDKKRLPGILGWRAVECSVVSYASTGAGIMSLRIISNAMVWLQRWWVRKNSQSH